MAKPGVLGYIGIGKEATWGTGVAPTAYLPGTENITREIDRIRVEAPHGALVPLPSYRGRRRARGTIGDIPGHPVEMGHLLMAFFGAVGKSGTGPYTYTFSVADPVNGDYPRPPYSITSVKGGLAERFVGGQLNQLTLRQDANNYLVLSAEWLFRDFQTTSPPAAPAIPTGAPFTFRDFTLKRGGAAVSAYVEGVEITLSNNMEVVEALAMDIPTAVVIGVVQAQAQLTLEFDDLTLYNDFVSGAASTWEFVWTQGANSLTIRFQRGVVIADEHPLSGAGRLTATATIVAELDPATGKALEAVLIHNTDTTY